MTTFSLASLVSSREEGGRSDDSHALPIAEKCALFDFGSWRAQILCPFSTLCTKYDDAHAHLLLTQSSRISDGGAAVVVQVDVNGGERGERRNAKIVFSN